MITPKFKDGLMDEYYRLFPPYKNKNIKLLEIGTYNNGFLEWANDYFKSAIIIGIDNACRTEAKNGIILIQADQNNKESLEKICKEHGPFDIIIDDASHFTEETKKTFNVFWNYIKPNGVYIIEDWMVGYWDNKGIHKRREGMEKFVAKLIVNKNELNIKNLEVMIKEPFCSLACFYK